MDIKLIIFDLDDTLLDTSKILIPIAGTAEFAKRIRQPLPLMQGCEETLIFLKNKYNLCLVTMGKVSDQTEKIKSLGIKKYFSQIEFADTEKNISKAECFKKIMIDNHLSAQQILSVGNRRSVEIRQAKQLGMKTCLFLHGEHINEKIEIQADIPDFEISKHHELIPVCHL